VDRPARVIERLETRHAKTRKESSPRFIHGKSKPRGNDGDQFARDVEQRGPLSRGVEHLETDYVVITSAQREQGGI